jgi:hypothetical protein
MSKLSTLLKRVILWMLGSGKIEFLLDVASKVVSRISNRENLNPEEKRKAAIDEIRQKLRDLGKEYSSHMINLAIELALVELKEELE